MDHKQVIAQVVTGHEHHLGTSHLQCDLCNPFDKRLYLSIAWYFQGFPHLSHVILQNIEYKSTLCAQVIHLYDGKSERFVEHWCDRYCECWLKNGLPVMLILRGNTLAMKADLQPC